MSTFCCSRSRWRTWRRSAIQPVGVSAYLCRNAGSDRAGHVRAVRFIGHPLRSASRRRGRSVSPTPRPSRPVQRGQSASPGESETRTPTLSFDPPTASSSNLRILLEQSHALCLRLLHCRNIARDFEASMIAPDSSRTGDRVSATSFVTRTVSKRRASSHRIAWRPDRGDERWADDGKRVRRAGGIQHASAP